MMQNLMSFWINLLAFPRLLTKSMIFITSWEADCYKRETKPYIRTMAT